MVGVRFKADSFVFFSGAIQKKQGLLWPFQLV